MIGLHGDDVRTQLARLARKRAGLDAERLSGVAGSDRDGGIGSRAVELPVSLYSPNCVAELQGVLGDAATLHPNLVTPQRSYGRM
jgi:hypothetical protein